MNSSKHNKSFVPARNIDLHFDTRDMVPFYTKLVDGIYTRPIVVTFLFPRKYCRKLNVSSPSSNERKESLMARSSSPNFNESVLYEPSVSVPGSPVTGDRLRQHDTEDDDVLSVDFHQQKVQEVIKHARISKHFVITVTDVVESRDASYKVIVRDYKDLLKELKTEYHGSNAVQDYFNPQSIRWWIAYIDQVLLVFDRPSGKLGVLVDKGKIAHRVKRKMEHHQWMVDKLNASVSSADDGDFKQSKKNMHGSVLHGDVKLSSAMESMLAHFEQLPDEANTVKEQKDQSAEHVASVKNDPLEDSIDDFAIVGRDEPKPLTSNIDAMEAQEVHDEEHEDSNQANSASSQPAGAITANILDDLSISASSDKVPLEQDESPQPKDDSKENHEDEMQVKKTPKKRKIRSTENNNGQSSKVVLASTNSTKSRDNTNPETTKKQPPQKIRSSLLGTQITSSENQSIRNSSSLPTISHSDGHHPNSSAGHGNKHTKSQAPIVITPQQGRTNKLLEDAYGVAATSVLFPASYAREEERLKQSILASLPGNKLKKRASTAAGGSSKDNHALSRSHEGRLPSITQPNSSHSPIKNKDKPSSIFNRTTDVDNGKPVDEEISMDLSEIVHQVANRVNREIEELETSQDNEKFSPIDGDESFQDMNHYSPDSDSQYDPYRHLAVSSAFVSIERSMSPQPRPGSPFAEELKHLKGSKRLAAELIHKARKSVSGNAKFQVRKISFSEKKLLDSPFAKKLWIEPVNDASRVLILDGGSSTASNDSPMEAHLKPPLSNDLLPVDDGTALSLHAASTTSFSVTTPHKQHPSSQKSLHSTTKRQPTASGGGRSSLKTAAHSSKPSKRGSTAPSAGSPQHVAHVPPKDEKCQDHDIAVVVIVENEQQITTSENVAGMIDEKEHVGTTVTTASSSKIIYLDTDDSVTVEEKLDLTIAHLAPEAPPASDANTLAQEEALREEQQWFAEQDHERVIESESTPFKDLEMNNSHQENLISQGENVEMDGNDGHKDTDESVMFDPPLTTNEYQEESATAVVEVETGETNFDQTEIPNSEITNAASPEYDNEVHTSEQNYADVDTNYQYSGIEGENTSYEVNYDVNNGSTAYDSQYDTTEINNSNGDGAGELNNAYYEATEEIYPDNYQNLTQTQEEQQ